ncbi:MAG TPA: response regulator [Flavisolibacter sp.]|jgi:CheY-like chemotaxis protein|nr:response regulator [Flavisolibacter sp.]
MQPKKILLAEDDADDRLFFFDFLHQRKDISLLKAVENGEEVFAFLEKAEGLPDLIILDQNMPRCNGLQALEMLKSKSAYVDIPVFVYSTHANERLRQQSMALGAALVLPKPLTFEGYHEMVDAFLLAAGYL